MDCQEMSKKRGHTEDLNENLNNDDFDVTWGGKRSRYIYNFTLQSLESLNNNDSETDSTRSTRTKSTVSRIYLINVEAVSDEDTLSCRSNCSCKDTNQEINQTEEFEVKSLSSLYVNSNSSDSSTTLSNEVLQNVISYNDTLSNTDNRYSEDTTQETNLPPPACFKKCLQCRIENPNPYFQFCFKCFKNRMELFVTKPQKPKRIKRLNIFLNRKLRNSIPSLGEGSNLSLKGNKSDFVNQNELCNFCLLNPKNGIINHGKIGHIVCCYSCAKQLWRTSKKCPLCNVKIKFVTKMIVV